MGVKLRRMAMLVGMGCVLLCGCGKGDASLNADIVVETDEISSEVGSVETENTSESIEASKITLDDIDYELGSWLYDEIITDFNLTDFEMMEDNSIFLDFEFIFVDGQTLKGKLLLDHKTVYRDLKLYDFIDYSSVPELYIDEKADGDSAVKVLLGKRINHWKWTSDIGNIKIYNTLVYNEEDGVWDTTGDLRIVWNGEAGEQQCEMHIDKIDKIYLPEFADDYDGDGVTDYVYCWKNKEESYYYCYYIEMSTAGNMQIGSAGTGPDVYVDISAADLTGDGHNEIVFYNSHWTSAYNYSHTSVYMYSDGEFVQLNMPISMEGHEFTIDRDMTRVILSCEDAGFSDVYWDEIFGLDSYYYICQGEETSRYTPCHSSLIEYDNQPAIRYWYYIGSKWDAIFIEEIVTYKDGIETTVSMKIDSPNSITTKMEESGDSTLQYEYSMDEKNSFFYSIHKKIADSGLDFVYRLDEYYDNNGMLSNDNVGIYVHDCDEGEWEKIEALAEQISQELGINTVSLYKNFDTSKEQTDKAAEENIDINLGYSLYDEIISDFKLTAVEKTEDAGLVLDFEITFVDGQTCKGKMLSDLKTSKGEMKLDDFYHKLPQPKIEKEKDDEGNITAKVMFWENIRHKEWSAFAGDIKVYDTLAYDNDEGKWDTTGDCEIVWKGEDGEQRCEMHIEKTDRIYLPDFADDYDDDGVTDSVYRWRCDYGYNYYVDMSSAGNLKVGMAEENNGMTVRILPADLTGNGRKEILFIKEYDSMFYDISRINAFIYDGGEYVTFELPLQKSGHEFTVDRDRTRVKLTCEDTGFSDAYWETIVNLDEEYNICQGTLTSKQLPVYANLTEYNGQPAIVYEYVIGKEWDVITVQEVVTYRDGVEKTVSMQIASPNSITTEMKAGQDYAAQYEYPMDEADKFFYKIHNRIADSGLDFTYRLEKAYKDGKLRTDYVTIHVYHCDSGDWEKIEELAGQIANEFGMDDVRLYLDFSYEDNAGDNRNGAGAERMVYWTARLDDYEVLMRDSINPGELEVILRDGSEEKLLIAYDSTLSSNSPYCSDGSVRYEGGVFNNILGHDGFYILHKKLIDSNSYDSYNYYAIEEGNLVFLAHTQDGGKLVDINEDGDMEIIYDWYGMADGGHVKEMYCYDGEKVLVGSILDMNESTLVLENISFYEYDYSVYYYPGVINVR